MIDPTVVDEMVALSEVGMMSHTECDVIIAVAIDEDRLAVTAQGAEEAN